MNENGYAIITPAYNEGEFLPVTIDSIAEQEVKPLVWIIVDDRSTDDTWSVIQAAAEKYDFIVPLQVTGDKTRRLGANVVHVFNFGLDHLRIPVDFLVKLDADIGLPSHYFASILKEFKSDPQLGMASGKPYIKIGREWVVERAPDHYVIGASQVFRWTCFQEIGGLTPILGWDVIDNYQAKFKGWRTRSYRDLPMYHMRQMGSEMGVIKSHMNYGKVQYIIRAHPLWVLAKAVYRTTERPYYFGLAMLIGYLKAAQKKEVQISDLGLARYIRREQRQRLMGRTIKQEMIFQSTIKKWDRTKG